MNPGEDMSGLAAIAWLRAARARERALRADAVAEQNEILAAESGREVYRRIAAGHRKAAACHHSSAQLQEAYARRVSGWAKAGGARPRFMSGVAEACGTRSAALTLVGADQDQLAVAASDEQSRAAQDVEYVLGEGPARDAAMSRCLILASGPAIEARWPGYGPAVAKLGISTVVTAPLEAPSKCIGALAVFDPYPGVDGTGVVVEIAETLARTMLLGPDADPELYGGTDHRDSVHRAAGMVSVQANCSIGDALAIIKARAFAEEVSTEAIADKVMRGELKLT